MISRIFLVVVTIVVLVLVNASCYTLDETEQAIRLRFNRPVGNAVTKAGLHFKMPFVDKIRVFDKRLLAWDGEPDQILTLERQSILVDTTARWRIVDPLLFFQRLKNERDAQTRLDDVIDSVVRNTVSSTNLGQLVRSSSWEETDAAGPSSEQTEDQPAGREEVEALILSEASENMGEFGIELVDVRLKRVNYIESVQKQVFNRMIAERRRVAQQYRSEGEGEASRITGETERDLAQIRSGAQRDAEIIRGQADAEATKIYAEAYGKDPEFYGFLRTLESYTKTLNERSTLMLSADSPYLRFLKGEPMP